MSDKNLRENGGRRELSRARGVPTNVKVISILKYCYFTKCGGLAFLRIYIMGVCCHICKIIIIFES